MWYIVGLVLVFSYAVNVAVKLGDHLLGVLDHPLIGDRATGQLDFISSKRHRS
jgi:hypothetical protein